MAESIVNKQNKHVVGDANLPAITASLEKLTVNTNLSQPEKKRIIRRIPSADSSEGLNRRCSLRPRKRTGTEMETNDKQNKARGEVDVKNYYLNRREKRKLNTLETIYEEKDDLSENTTYMSVKRYKRTIQFQDKPSDCKLRKRRAKIKKVFGLKSHRRSASTQMLLDHFNSIRAESPAKINSETE
ncbi:uncharacterized protein LOC116430597 isoform X2 [Nomia melanderi]|uniref:uncharacterized protein LOC116430597 isoform X2 n=1 Tax=Nomia melanderi TaxID=2448451 RepID=UPI001303FEE2|nr:uncharacterized protein LOC116430597 isoform X2 [Nomia melanderi]